MSDALCLSVCLSVGLFVSVGLSVGLADWLEAPGIVLSRHRETFQCCTYVEVLKFDMTCEFEKLRDGALASILGIIEEKKTPGPAKRTELNFVFLPIFVRYSR